MAEAHDDKFDDVSVNPQAILAKNEWHDAVDSAFQRAQENHRPVSVIFLDINSFKQVNDTLGHLVGDEVIDDLKRLVPLVANSLRTRPSPNLPEDTRHEEQAAIDLIAPPDFSNDEMKKRPRRVNEVEAQAGHVGGDEFAILAETDELGARIVRFRLIEALEEYINDPRYPVREKYRELGVGFAIGSATSTPYMNSGSELLQAADRAMYEDKIAQLAELNFLRKVLFNAGRFALRLSGVDTRQLEGYISKYDN